MERARPPEGEVKFGIKAGRRGESKRETEKGGALGTGDKRRTFHKEAAVAPPQQKPHPRATPKCWTAKN